MGAAEKSFDMEEGTLEIGMGEFLHVLRLNCLSDLILVIFLLKSFSLASYFLFAEYRTVSGVAGPLVILDKVKVYVPYLLSSSVTAVL